MAFISILVQNPCQSLAADSDWFHCSSESHSGDSEREQLVSESRRDEIIIELKSSEIMHPVYEAQIISYLKLAKKNIIINFYNIAY